MNQPPLLRREHTNDAKMLPKASDFNEKIHMRYDDWNNKIGRIMSELCEMQYPNDNPLDPPKYIINRGHGYKLSKRHSEDGETRRIIEDDENMPQIFLLGGNAIAGYINFFSDLYPHQVSSHDNTKLYQDSMAFVAPRSHDWDISVCADGFEHTSEFTSYLKATCQNLYRSLNVDGYIDDNFVLVGFSLERNEKRLYMHRSGKMEVTYIRNRRYYNFRFNMAITTTDGQHEKDHIIELILWRDDALCKSHNRPYRLILNDTSIYVASPSVLVENALKAIQSRGTIRSRFAKCRQDVKRIASLVRIIDRYQSPLKIYNWNRIKTMFRKYRYIYKHCFKDTLTPDEFNKYEDILPDRGIERDIIYITPGDNPENRNRKQFIANKRLIFDSMVDSYTRLFNATLDPSQKNYNETNYNNLSNAYNSNPNKTNFIPKGDVDNILSDIILDNESKLHKLRMNTLRSDYPSVLHNYYTKLENFLVDVKELRSRTPIPTAENDVIAMVKRYTVMVNNFISRDPSVYNLKLFENLDNFIDIITSVQTGGGNRDNEDDTDPIMMRENENLQKKYNKYKTKFLSLTNSLNKNKNLV